MKIEELSKETHILANSLLRLIVKEVTDDLLKTNQDKTELKG